jgi:hypothetical protein
MAASPLLGPRDSQDFATLFREMDASLEFRNFAGAETTNY